MPTLQADRVLPTLMKGASARVDRDIAPRFSPGQRVWTKNIHPLDHTRLPRYARGREGVIDRDHGVFVFPDSNAAGEGTNPQHCYCVRFPAQELWGPQASPRDSVYIDLFEDYLMPAARPGDS